jgi:hypothetical protein
MAPPPLNLWPHALNELRSHELYLHLVHRSWAPLALRQRGPCHLRCHQKQQSSAHVPADSGAAILDFAPDPTGGEGCMHRTQTLDYVDS